MSCLQIVWSNVCVGWYAYVFHATSCVSLRTLSHHVCGCVHLWPSSSLHISVLPDSTFASLAFHGGKPPALPLSAPPVFLKINQDVVLTNTTVAPLPERGTLSSLVWTLVALTSLKSRARILRNYAVDGLISSESNVFPTTSPPEHNRL